MDFRLLFWNLGDRELSQLLTKLVKERDIGFLAVCEAKNLSGSFVSDLCAETGRRFYEIEPVVNESNKVRLFAEQTTSARFEIVQETASGRLVICRVILPTLEFFIAAVHLDSKVNSTANSQSSEAQIVAGQIRHTETRFGHRRTLVIGDFNMNPFEYGMIAAAGFHGVMDQQIALEGSRIVKSIEYPFLYNPMWGAFGDRTAGPAGTHFFRASEHEVFFWNMFDQAMLRPQLLSYFQNDLAILDMIGDVKICSSKGRPAKHIASDHFPLFIQLVFP